MQDGKTDTFKERALSAGHLSAGCLWVIVKVNRSFPRTTNPHLSLQDALRNVWSNKPSPAGIFPVLNHAHITYLGSLDVHISLS